MLAVVSHDLAIPLFAVGAAPVSVACVLAVYFGFIKPEKLQSEEYQLKQAAMEFIKQQEAAVTLAPSSLEAIANPYRNQIDSK